MPDPVRHHPGTFLGELPPDFEEREVRQLEDALRELGDRMHQDQARAPDAEHAQEPELRALQRTGRVHFMSFFVVAPEAGVGPGYACLEISWDGDGASLHDALANTIQGPLRCIFGHCPDYPREDSGPTIEAFLRKIDRGADAFYVGTPDRGARQVLQERDLCEKLGAELGLAPDSDPGAEGATKRGWQGTAGATWRMLQGEVPRERASDPPRRSMRVRLSPRRGGLGRRLRAMRRALGWVLTFTIGLIGLLDLGVRGAASLGRAAPPAAIIHAPAWLLAQLDVLVGVGLLGPAVMTVCALPWLREAPRPLTASGWRIVLTALLKRYRSWAWRSALVLGLLGALPRLLALGHPVIGDVLTLVVGAALLAIGALFVFACFGGIASLLSVPLWIAVGVALLDAPPPPYPREFAAAVALLISGVVGSGVALATVVLAHVVAHVAWGRVVGVLVPCALAITWGGLLSQLWTDPIRLLLAWIVLVALLALTVTVQATLYLLALRRLEAREPQMETSWQLDHLGRVQRLEDRYPQNHLVNVSTIKGEPGSWEHAVRHATLRAVLRAVSLAARHVFNRGDLGGIKSIHFARFLILPDNRRLLFLSNYDGAFGSYLGDFTDVVGVTAVWGNTVGFPRPLFLLEGGIEDEQRFKAFGRAIQRETLGWFSAYPRLSVQNIDDATAVCAALARPVSEEPVGNQKPRIWRRSPMTEAECDAVLRRI